MAEPCLSELVLGMSSSVAELVSAVVVPPLLSRCSFSNVREPEQRSAGSTATRGRSSSQTQAAKRWSNMCTSRRLVNWTTHGEGPTNQFPESCGSNHILRAWLDPPNTPQPCSQEVVGSLGTAPNKRGKQTHSPGALLYRDCVRHRSL